MNTMIAIKIKTLQVLLQETCHPVLSNEVIINFAKLYKEGSPFTDIGSLKRKLGKDTTVNVQALYGDIKNHKFLEYVQIEKEVPELLRDTYLAESIGSDVLFIETRIARYLWEKKENDDRYI